MEIEVISISEYEEKKRKLRYKFKNTALYKIFLFQEFKGQFNLDFLPFDLKANSLLCLNKRVDIDLQDIEFMEGKVMLISDRFFNEIEKADMVLQDTLLFNELFPAFHLELNEEHSYFNNLLRLLESEINNCEQDFKMEIMQNYLFSFLLLAERERRRQLNINEKQNVDLFYALAFKSLVDENFRISRSVSYYASKLGVSKIKLNEVTINIYGKMAKQIIDDKTMIEAKRLLVNTSDEIQKISFDLGFDEPTYLSKFFKRNNENSPGDFRKKHLKVASY